MQIQWIIDKMSMQLMLMLLKKKKKKKKKTYIEYVQAKLIGTQATICKCAITCTITVVRNCSISYAFTNNCIFSKVPKYNKPNVYTKSICTHMTVRV